MIRTSIDDVSDEDFDNIVLPFDEEITKYIDEKIVSEYVAYYIATGYKMSSIWNSSLKAHCNASIDCLADIKHFDYDKIKGILEEKYGLKIVNEEKLEIEEIKN